MGVIMSSYSMLDEKLLWSNEEFLTRLQLDPLEHSDLFDTSVQSFSEQNLEQAIDHKQLVMRIKKVNTNLYEYTIYVNKELLTHANITFKLCSQQFKDIVFGLHHGIRLINDMNFILMSDTGDAELMERFNMGLINLTKHEQSDILLDIYDIQTVKQEHDMNSACKTCSAQPITQCCASNSAFNVYTGSYLTVTSIVKDEHIKNTPIYLNVPHACIKLSGGIVSKPNILSLYTSRYGWSNTCVSIVFALIICLTTCILVFGMVMIALHFVKK